MERAGEGRAKDGRRDRPNRRTEQERGDVPIRPGDVFIYLVDEGRWAWRAKVDADELIRTGAASTSEPEA